MTNSWLSRRLGASWDLLRSHPFILSGMGAAVVTSLGSVCCGVGLVAAPWLTCELLAFQLGHLLDRRVERTRAWIGAGLLQSVGVAVIAMVASLVLSWLGPTIQLEGPMDGRLWPPTLAAVGSVIALTYLVPFLFAPLLLIERGGTLGGAVIDSARIAVSGGLGRYVIFSTAAHLLQVAPALVVGLGTLFVADRSVLPFALAASLPLMMITVPLGQGMIVAEYAERRAAVTEAGRPSTPGLLPGPLAVVAGVALAAPAIALFLVFAALLAKPALPAPGPALDGHLVAQLRQTTEEPKTLSVPNTTLEVRASTRSLAVVAGDGGGAGRIPLPPDRTVDRVRVLRIRDRFAVELTSGGDRWTTVVSRAGVRLDDDLPARLADHLPSAGLAFVLASLVVASVSIARSLRRLGDLPQRTREEPAFAPSLEGHARALRRTWIATLVALPLSLAALVYGILAVR